MYNLTNIFGTGAKPSIEQIDSLIAETEKNIEYLGIFPSQELAKLMLRNVITSLNNIKKKIQEEAANRPNPNVGIPVPVPYIPPTPNAPKIPDSVPPLPIGYPTDPFKWDPWKNPLNPTPKWNPYYYPYPCTTVSNCVDSPVKLKVNKVNEPS